MPRKFNSLRFWWLFLSVLLACSSAFAQFTASIQGVVQDASGSGVARATISLTNNATGVMSTTTTDASGNYRFLSLAPGSYRVTAEASGFAKSGSDITLLTEQNLSVPITLKVGSVSEQITVTAEAPLVNTAETRNQMTLETQSLSSLPLEGRSFISLVTLAPGVSGLGTMGGGTPGEYFLV